MIDNSTYFIINRLDNRDPNRQHMYVVKSRFMEPPQFVIDRSHYQKIVGVTRNLEALEAMQRLLINDAMLDWISSHGKWPMLEGWH